MRSPRVGGFPIGALSNRSRMRERPRIARRRARLRRVFGTSLRLEEIPPVAAPRPLPPTGVAVEDVGIRQLARSTRESVLEDRAGQAHRAWPTVRDRWEVLVLQMHGSVGRPFPQRP